MVNEHRYALLIDSYHGNSWIACTVNRLQVGLILTRLQEFSAIEEYQQQVKRTGCKLYDNLQDLESGYIFKHINVTIRKWFTFEVMYISQDKDLLSLLWGETLYLPIFEIHFKQQYTCLALKTVKPHMTTTLKLRPPLARLHVQRLVYCVYFLFQLGNGTTPV